MYKIIAILSTFCLFSCAKNYDYLYIDPEIQPYYNDFLNSGKMYGKDYSTDNLVVEFGDTSNYKKNSKPIGICKTSIDFKNEFGSLVRHTHTYPHIIIDKQVFDYLDEYSRRALIFHELGHCVLQRTHDESINELGYVKSIMYPSLITQRIGFFYQLLEKYYIEELFSPQSAQMKNLSVKSQQKIGSEKLTENSKSDIFIMVEGGCENSVIE